MQCFYAEYFCKERCSPELESSLQRARACVVRSTMRADRCELWMVWRIKKSNSKSTRWTTTSKWLKSSAQPLQWGDRLTGGQHRITERGMLIVIACMNFNWLLGIYERRSCTYRKWTRRMIWRARTGVLWGREIIRRDTALWYFTSYLFVKW